MTYQLIRGDATSIPLADDSVDVVVTSPPYFALRSYQDECSVCSGVGQLSATPETAAASGIDAMDCPECRGTGRGHYDGQIGSEDTPHAFLEALWAVTAECRRVLKPSGSMFVNLGDKYARNGGSGNGAGSSDATTGRGDRPLGSTTTAGFPEKSLMMLPHRYAIGCIDQLDLILRADIIWSKPNGLPESVTDRVRRSHEDWFHFTKAPRYYTAVDEIREPQLEPDRSRPGVIEHMGTGARAASGANQGFGLTGDNERVYNPLGKLPGSVWTVPTEPLRLPPHLPQHFAAFPSKWPRRLILGWSPPGICVECGQGRRPVVDKNNEPTQATNGTDYRRAAMPDGGSPDRGRQRTAATITGYACDCPTPDAPTRPAVVLDPFVGTGTTVAVAHHLGRHGIGIDLSADYLRVAHWRCNDPKLRAKVLRVDPPKPEIDGQEALFA